jgi:hypothetical protein
MFYPVEGGSTLEVQGLKCQLPPVGWVKNVLTGELEHTGVWERSKNPKGQHWERTELPPWFKERRKKELAKQKTDPEYYDPDLAAIIKTEWYRRLNGFWFMNYNPHKDISEPTYMTGTHYFYCKWWSLDIGYPDFRITDLEYYYFQQYCIEDPHCLGMIEIAKRRHGKTYKGGLFLFEFASRMQEAVSGLQSKTNTDGRKVFRKAVVRPFRKLPYFFQPAYDQTAGKAPQKELRFMAGNIRGHKADDIDEMDELNSSIDFGPSDEEFYDGQKLHRYLGDEVGKTRIVDVYERHQIVRYCLMSPDGKVLGKALYTTTVEDMGKDQFSIKRFRKLWDNSSQYEKFEKGVKWTKTGLYRYLVKAYRCRHVDKYGHANEKLALEEMMEERAIHADDPKALSALIRKEPNDEQEAFRVDASRCHYNPNLLYNRRDYLTINGETNFWARGNFSWKDNKPFTEVVFTPNPRGRWRVSLLFPDRAYANNVQKRGNLFYPGNKLRFITGVDPYDHDITEDENRASMGCGTTLHRHDMSSPFFKDYGMSFVCVYLGRPSNADLYYMDMAMQCWYYGSKMIFESQKPGIKKFFIRKGMEHFLVMVPGYADYGIPSSVENKNELVYATENYIDNWHHRINHILLIDDWLDFDIRDTQKYDCGMASGWTLVGNLVLDIGRRRVESSEQGEEERSFEDYFDEYEIPT